MRSRQRHYRGQYSIERLCALSYYTDTTSRARVLAVGILTIAPPLLVILFLDVIPLQDPASGWESNYSMWIRVFTGSFMLAIGVSLQLQVMAPAARLNIRKSVGVALVTGAGNCVASILLAMVWAFPVPFMAILTLPSWLTLFCSGIVLTIGLDNLRQNPLLIVQIKRYATKLYIESNLLLIYPAYNVVFVSLSGVEQLAFIFALPAIKFVLKKITNQVVADLEDLVPVVVITIDLFNALYQSKCMQSSGSIYTTIGIIAIDAIQNFLSLRQLFEYMREVEELTNDDIVSQGALAFALKLVSEPHQLDAEALLELRVNSCVNMSLSKEQMGIIERMQLLQDKAKAGFLVVGINENQHTLSDRQARSGDENGPGSRSSHNAVVPWTKDAQRQGNNKSTSGLLANSTKIVPSVAVQPQQRSERTLTNKEKATVLERTLELLWKCERLLLVEYVESAIPLLYAVYLAILYQLPNAAYYPGISEMTPEKLQGVILSILIYGFLELLSLLYVHAILQWKFKLSPLHQLAFALENERLLIQGMLMAWVIVILQFTLLHYGIDFTFQFDWIAKQSNSS